MIKGIEERNRLCLYLTCTTYYHKTFVVYTFIPIDSLLFLGCSLIVLVTHVPHFLELNACPCSALCKFSSAVRFVTSRNMPPDIFKSRLGAM